MSSSESLFEQGTTLDDRYQLEQLLGSGGMGWVFLARDLQLREQEVAVKIVYPHLLSTKSSFSRFQNEVSITRRLSHPAIVQTYGFGFTSDGFAYVAMEYVKGETLKERILRSNGSLPFEEVEAILLQIVAGLRFAHEGGVIHRDLKPDNVLLKEDGSVKMADFGLAQLFRDEAHLTQTGHMVGTPIYMSPEQLQGESLDFRSDIYSLGILGFELAAGHPPFQGDALFEVAQKHLESPLPQLPSGKERRPSWFSEFLEECTEKAPEDRFSSLREILDFLTCRVSGASASIERSVGISPIREPQKAPALKWSSVVSWFWLLLVLIPFWVTMGYSHYNKNVQADLAGLLFGFENWCSETIPPLQWAMGPVQWVFGIDREEYERNVLFDSASDRRILLAGVLKLDPNTKHPQDGDYAIHRLAHKRQSISSLRKISRFIDLGVDFDLQNAQGETPLHTAISLGQLKMVELFLSKGANPNSKNAQGWTPLGRAIRNSNSALITILSLYRADPNIRLPEGGTALHFAAEAQDWKTIRLLFHRGADADVQDYIGRTPLMMALIYGGESRDHKKTIEVLVKNSSVELEDAQGKTALDYAHQGGDDVAVELLNRAVLASKSRTAYPRQ